VRLGRSPKFDDFDRDQRALAHSEPVSRAGTLAPTTIISVTSRTSGAAGVILVALTLVRTSSRFEELRVDELAGEHDLSIVGCFDLGTSNDEVAGCLDVDDEVIALDLSDRAHFFSAFFEEDMIADADFEIVLHDGFLPSGV
jgi:hypothetical protein